MAWDGSGNYTRSNGTQSGATTWADADAAGNDITTSQHDTHDEDLADGIAACLTKNNESKPTANFVPNANNSYDLGTTSVKWRSLYLSANIFADGTISAGNGSVGAPSIQFAAATDSGFWSISADNIGLALGGAKVVDFATTGITVTGDAKADTYHVGATAGVDFSGAITNLTVVKGIVTAAS